MRRFVQVWKRARAASVALPSVQDPAYQSLDTLGHHVLRAARGYVVWICEMLQLPDPGIGPAPEPSIVSDESERYLEHLLAGWRTALRDVRDEQLETPEYASRWKTRYSIDAMLEHAVMHPIRHAFQLEDLMDGRRSEEAAR